MHPTATSNCQAFFNAYSGAFAAGSETKVVEIGSQNVNGNLRGTVPSGFEYVGVDFVSGDGVDVVLDDPYVLPFEDCSADIVISSSCFEHSEMFWIVFLEIMRVLKPKGLFYLNAPSNGSFHRYPVDCWRFYPDSGGALVKWARRNSINATLLESYVSAQGQDAQSEWNDFIAVFLKDERYAADFPTRILDSKEDIFNGILRGNNTFLKPTSRTEDQKKLYLISKIIENQIRVP